VHLIWLEDFIELARTRSFSRAAENRFVTHPAFGRRIKALEQWVGAELVVRTHPVSLTAAGQLFLDAATHSTDVLYAARAQLQDGSGGLLRRDGDAGRRPRSAAEKAQDFSGFVVNLEIRGGNLLQDPLRKREELSDP